MKKNYFLGTLMSLLMLVALPVKAQVSSMVDLYGKYKFTSEMTVTEAGKAYQEHFAAESDVVITKDNTYDAQITGIAGAKNSPHQVNKFDESSNSFVIYNWNGGNTAVFGGGVCMSNADGIYPYGWGDMPQLGDLVFSFNPETKEITMPDFTLVTVDHANSSAEILATFKNAKLTLVEAETIEVIDLSGDWHFKAGTGQWSVLNDSTASTEFDMVITKTTEDNKNYKVGFTYESYPTVELDATFNGVEFSLALDSAVLDAEKGIFLRRPYGNAYSKVTFNVISKTTMSLSTRIGIAQYNPEHGDTIEHYTYVQYFMDGTARKQEADNDRYDWAGTYTVKAGQVNVADGAEHPAEFTMTVEYVEATDAYYIKEFYGNNIYDLNYGATRLEINPENSKEATLNTGIFVGVIESQVLYYQLFDATGATGPIKFSVNEDGTITVGDFFIQRVDYSNGGALAPAAFYTNVTATKQAAEEPEELTWDGTYAVTADVEMLADGECPKTFEMVITYNSEWDFFAITSIMGGDVSSANNGGITFTPAENTATIKTGSYVKVVESGKLYWKMFDADGGNNPLDVTRAEDGSLTITDFTVYTMEYDADWNQTLAPLAKYTNVKAVKGTVDAIESVQQNTAKANGKTYDLSGRLVKKAAKGIFIQNGKKVIIK